MLAAFISSGLGLAFVLGAVLGIAVDRRAAVHEAEPSTSTIPTIEGTNT